MRRSRAHIVSGAVLGVPALLGGCLERKMQITSEPPGALVWVNDVEVGRTPVETDFTFYGQYDVRLRLEGYEPITTHRSADLPIQEVPPIDFFATIVPFTISDTVKWHFVLAKRAEETDAAEAEGGVIERAHELRGMLDKKPD